MYINVIYMYIKNRGGIINTEQAKVVQIGKEESHVTLKAWNGSCSEEVRSRITLGEVAFGIESSLETAMNIFLSFMKIFSVSFVLSVDVSV